MRRALVALLALALLLSAAASAVGAPKPTQDALPPGQQPEVNITELEGEVMCPVCGTLLELAESPQAEREKAFVARLIGEGKSKDEIKDALVTEYGPAVLALPQGSGFDLSAYLVPIIAFIIAVLALGFAVYRWRRSSGPPDDRPASARGPTAAESERLDADLGRYDL